MFTCTECGFGYDANTGDVDERMCNDCIDQYYCDHDNEEYQPAEPDNNVKEGMVCADGGAELPIPEPNYGVQLGMPYDEKPPSAEDLRHFSTMKSGAIGETAVIHDLTINYPEFDVYIPIVDDKGVDILVDTGVSFRKIQVKTVNAPKTGGTSFEVDFRKHIKAKHTIDIFAVFFTPIKKIAYIPWDGQKRANLAFKRAKNNQEMKRDSFYNYLDFPVWT